MSDTEWIDSPYFITRSLSGYFLDIVKHMSKKGAFVWCVRRGHNWIIADGRSRTVSCAKRQCMRAMNRHRKESQP